jgi:hypothetical protein
VIGSNTAPSRGSVTSSLLSQSIFLTVLHVFVQLSTPSLPICGTRSNFLIQHNTHIHHHFIISSSSSSSSLHRIAELFDVIVNWPESRSAIVDLKECLTKTNAHNDLVITLQRLFVFVSLSLSFFAFVLFLNLTFSLLSRK